MTRYLGEVGNLLEPLVIVSRSPHGTGLSEIGSSLFRTLADSVPIKWLNIDEYFTYFDISKELLRGRKVVFTELPSLKPKILKAIRNRKNRGYISVIYVWDSNQIPDEDQRNLRLFDEVFVPNVELKAVLEGLGIRATVIPLALDTRDFYFLSQKTRKYGLAGGPASVSILSVGSFHPRKNHALLIDAAVNLLRSGEDIYLRIHSNLDFQGQYSRLKQRIPLQFLEKIQITLGHLDRDQLVDLYDQADVYASLSGGETFNIGLRNAIAAGLPVLATAVPGHNDLVDYPGVALIPCEIAIPAIYPERGNAIFGNQTAPSQQVVISALKDLISSPSRIDREVPEWDFRIAKFRLRRELLKHGPASSKKLDLRVVAHDGGFFSIFNSFVSLRNTWADNYQINSVEPIWTVDEMVKFFNTHTFQSFCYGKRTDGNIFWELFSSTPKAVSSRPTKKSITLHSFNAFSDPDLTYVHASRLYRSVGFRHWRSAMHETLGDFSPEPEIMSRVNASFSTLGRNDFVIGMHVRHPSHAIEQPDKKIALASDYIRVARQLESVKKASDSRISVKFFLATDQEIVVDIFRKEFGNQLLTIHDVSRTTVDQDNSFASLSESEQLKEGHQVQHLMSANEANWSLDLAREVLVDAWSLARCDYLLHSVSNVATAVSFINPKIEMLLMAGGDTYESSFDRQIFAKKSALL